MEYDNVQEVFNKHGATYPSLIVVLERGLHWGSPCPYPFLVSLSFYPSLLVVQAHTAPKPGPLLAGLLFCYPKRQGLDAQSCCQRDFSTCNNVCCSRRRMCSGGSGDVDGGRLRLSFVQRGLIRMTVLTVPIALPGAVFL